MKSIEHPGALEMPAVNDFSIGTEKSGKYKRSVRARKFLELDFAFDRSVTKPISSFVVEEARWTKKNVHRLVQHRAFILFIASVIILNAVYIGLETELAPTDGAIPVEWYLAEVAFTVIFFVELCLRAVDADNAREFVSDSWNIFDLFLVSFSCVDTFVFSFMSQDKGELKLVNTIRTVRLARVIRLFRLFRFLQDLWLLVAGIIEAMQTLVWTWMLLILLVYIFGVFATRMLGQPHEDDVELAAYFGDVPRSMFTLFQITTTDGWADITRMATHKEPWAALFFIIYLYFTLFVVMNVVTAVIVENTLDQTGDQREKFLARRKDAHQEAAVGIYKLFRTADQNGDGVLTREEFLQQIQRAHADEDVRRYLHELGIDVRRMETTVHQAENLFSILDFDESDSLDAEEFVGGMMKAVGLAQAKDILAVECDGMRSSQTILGRLAKLRNGIELQMTTVERGVADLRRDVRTLARACCDGDVAPSLASASQMAVSAAAPPAEALSGCADVSPFPNAPHANNPCAVEALFS